MATLGRLLGRKPILSERAEELRTRERELLDRLATALERFGPDIAPEDLRHFSEAREQLAGLFLLVIAGEFNSGKSSFINALLGEKVLPEGVTPTTDRINLLRHGDEPGEEMLEAYLLQRTHPSPVLRDLHIVDTPGTNAIVREHEELTRDFVPRSDLVLFVTSADRPFTESEKGFLELIRAWGKKIVFIVNKIDILQNADERQQVLTFVQDNAATLLGEAPQVFPVSARQALGARLTGDDVLWRQSGFEAIEDYLLNTLDQQERIRLKLLNPLNVGLRLAGQYKDVAFERLKLLSDDVATLQNIDQQLGAFHQEMLRDFEPRLSTLDLLLREMETRGLNFFDETIRIGRIRSLMNSEQIRKDFERDVVADTPARIDEEVGKIIDWLVERNLRLWQDVGSYIDRRQIARHREQMIGEVGQQFNYNRQALLDSVGRTSKEVVSGYNREAEARKLADELRQTFGTTAFLGVGAIGLGGIITAVATTAAVDITGIVLATALAVGGLYVIPARRRQVKREFVDKIAQLRAQMNTALTRQVHGAISDSQEKINESIAPYRRFIQTQQDQLNEARGEMVVAEDALRRLKTEIEAR